MGWTSEAFVIFQRGGGGAVDAGTRDLPEGARLVRKILAIRGTAIIVTKAALVVEVIDRRAVLV
jgi:hypothetical protein